MSAWIKALIDYGPLAAFFIMYKLHGLLPATAVLIAASFLSVLVLYLLERKIATVPLVTAGLVGVFGGLTLWLQDEQFIKMKPTIINLLFAVILFGGLAMRKPLLKFVFKSTLKLTEKGWTTLTFRWAVYFVCLAAVNELVWRTQPTDIWVDFKVFGILGLTFLFTMLQLPLMKREMMEDNSAS